MIERIQIQNFQSHERLRIVFDEHITTIVGPSDAGKSAIIRAIRWLAFNRPRGNGFIRHGAKQASVRLWVDGNKIERRRNSSGNKYFINGNELSAVGTDVPEAVQAILNVTSDNFQGQHDSPFWFSLTPGEVAKRLNAIVDLEVIDRSASWLAKLLRGVRIERSVIEGKLEAAASESKRLEYVPSFAAQSRAIIESRNELEESQDEIQRLSDFIERARKLRRLAEQYGGALKAGRVVQQAGSSAFSLLERLNRLSGCMEAAESANEARNQSIPNLEPLVEARSRVDEIGLHMAELSSFYAVLVSKKAYAEEMAKAASRASKNLKDTLGGVCPYCGGKI